MASIPRPTVIQHVSGSNTLGGGVLPTSPSVTKIDFWLKNLSLSGNLLVLSATWDDPPGTITSSVADNLTHTWITAKSKVNDGTQQTSAQIFCVPNCNSGVAKITWTPSTGTDFIGLKFTEWAGMAQSSVVDVSSGAVDTASPYQPGSLTPTQKYDLLYFVSFGTSNLPTNITSYTPDTRFELLDADQFDDSVCQYRIYEDTLAINPQVTASPTTQRHLTMCVAFKSQVDAGSLPAAGVPHVYRMNHNNMWLDNGTSTYDIQCPCQGDHLVLLGTFIQASPLGNVSLNSITDNKGNTWRRAAFAFSPTAAAGRVEIWYAENAQTGSDLVITLKFSGTQSQSEFMVYDMTGIKASDSLGQTATNTGFQSTNANLQTLTSFTPLKGGGVTFMMASLDLHTASGLVTPSNGLFDAMVYPSADGTRGFDEDNGKAHYFHPDTTPFNVVWSIQNNAGGVNDWTACAAEFFVADPLAPSTVPLDYSNFPVPVLRDTAPTRSQ